MSESNSSSKLWDMRKDYEPSNSFIDLSKTKNPFCIFEEWFNEAKKVEDGWEANTMILSTVNS